MERIHLNRDAKSHAEKSIIVDASLRGDRRGVLKANLMAERPNKRCGPRTRHHPMLKHFD
jgi:hypothetical protein